LNPRPSACQARQEPLLDSHNLQKSKISSNELFNEYARFLEIDLLRADKTIRNHLSCLRNFQKFLNRDIALATKDDIRAFLQAIKPKFSSSTYANHIKAFRVLYRDFLGVSWSVNFKMPQPEFKPKWIPTKQELKHFYGALPSLKAKCMFLFYAATGLRNCEVARLKVSDIDLSSRMVIPKVHSGLTKKSWITFYNDEAEKVLEEYLKAYKPNENLFLNTKTHMDHPFRTARRTSELNITPQVLREWFACEMTRLGVPDRYVDAFCGRVPRSVLARHYTDFSPERLKEVYDKTGLKVLS